MMPAGLVLVAVVAWVALGRTRPRADWVQARGPRYAVAGQPLELEVAVAEAERPAYLTVDLRRSAMPGVPGGTLAALGSVTHGPESGDLPRQRMRRSVTFQVPRSGDLRYVFAVVYESETGSWSDRFLASASEQIPVRSAGSRTPRRRAWRMYRLEIQAGTRAAEAPSVAKTERVGAAVPEAGGGRIAHRLLAPASLAGALLCAACASRRRRRAPQNEASRDAVRPWALLAAFLFLAAGWTHLRIGELAVSALRAAAEKRNLYDLRNLAQRAVIAGTLAALAAVPIRLLTRPRIALALIVASGGAVVVAAVLVVRLVSFHYSDLLEGILILGAGLPDLVAGVGLAAVIAGAVSELARTHG
jgi:hypothetical protein